MQKFPPRQASLCANTSSSSNLENFSELEKESRSLDCSDKASDTDIQILQSQSTNSFSQISSFVTKCNSYCCNSSTAYHPIRENELVLPRVFYYSCRTAFEHELHPNEMKLNPTYKIFISEGYCDWKNALPRFKLHETSKLHLDSTYVINQQSRPTIAAQLISSTKRQQE
ncbi:unnamed protein product [Rotaria sp. Silwood2]|nr:unnamed protein product [Rotaria sp. Silwood2]CAF3420056.1 unnamed protein product [Rotaria sp. Silwood2]CAF4351033.1 unnamed protein product [Rotaria sp. Silwood2]CAF4467024.1 unnamed protein product [Rotaria sp. Silwood2]CAF4494471.1 unnamed protein product [Rotaria sp. Silwood2]